LLVKPTLTHDDIYHNNIASTIQQKLGATSSPEPSSISSSEESSIDLHARNSRRAGRQRSLGNILKLANGIRDKIDSVFDAWSNKDKSGDWNFHFLDGSSKIETLGDYQYQFFVNPERWEKAEQNCRTMGGHLVSIHDEHENNLVKKLTGEKIYTWIGYSDSVREGVWKWSDGSTSSYSKWQSHQPDNWARLEDCAATNFQGKGKWGDLSCALRLPYVCKRKSNECGWGDHEMKAPDPVVKKELKDDKVVISVQVPQKANQKVKYAIGFHPYDTDLMCPSRQCISENVIDLGEWGVCSDRCDEIFELQMDVKEFINYANPTIENCGNNLVNVKTKLYIVYFDDTDDHDHVCDISKFESTIEFQTTLIPDIDHEHLLFPPDYTSVTVNQQGKLVVDLMVRPRVPQVYCTRFFFKSHSNQIPFSLYYTEVECAPGRVSCAYRLNLVSQSAIEDYTGEIEVGFRYFDGNKECDNSFKMDLQYKLVQEPGVVIDVVETETKLTDENFTNEENVLSPFERAFLLTKTLHPMGIPDTRIRYKDVFFCCSRDNTPIAPYALGTEQKGCTERDDRTMSFWKQLVKNGVIQNSMDTKIENLGQLEMDKVALSFSPEELGLTDRMCSIHVRAKLESDHDQLRRSMVVEGEEDHHLDSSTVLTFKGCSYYGTKENCEGFGGESCRWNSESETCANEYSGEESSANGMGVNHLVGLLIGFSAALLLL